MEFAIAAPARHFGMLTSTIHLYTEILKQSYILNVKKRTYIFVFVPWCLGPMPAMVSSFLSHLDHTQRCTTVGRTPWTGNEPIAKTSIPDDAQHLEQINIHASDGIRTHNISGQAAADPRHRPRGHWDQQATYYYFDILYSLSVVEEE